MEIMFIISSTKTHFIIAYSISNTGSSLPNFFSETPKNGQISPTSNIFRSFQDY
jgi:hypothetical protein